MDLQVGQQRLAILWFATSALVFALVFLQTRLGHYQDPSAAWNWILPNLLPTLSLMIGVFVADATAAAAAVKKEIGRFFFYLTLSISAVYLLTILLIILLQPWGSTDQLAAMKQDQSAWLTPFQGLVTASLGAFFVKGKAAAG